MKAAFDNQVVVIKQTYIVLAKGIPRGIINKRVEEEIKVDIKKRNEVIITRYKRRILRSSNARFSLLLIKVKAVAIV